MFQSILVSFCNNPIASTSPLLCVKIPPSNDLAKDYAPVTLGFPGLTTHATGLTIADNIVMIAFHSGGKFYIAALDNNDLSPVFYQELPEALDIHSILAWNNCLYVVSTGTDEVLAYDIDQKMLVNPRVIWRASSEKRDSHHINSIVENKGELFISAFGPKSGELWASAPNGYIQNITRDIRVKDGIFHPHSLSARNEQIYYCESHNGTFCSMENKILKLPGYSRGITWLSDEIVCVTTSIGRKVSRSTGQVGNPGDPGEPEGHCGLTIANIANGQILSTMDFSWFGPEIYDALILTNQQIELLDLAIASQMADRQAIQSSIMSEQALTKDLYEQGKALQEVSAHIQTLSAQVMEKEQAMQTLSAQVMEKEQVVQMLSEQIHAIYRSQSWRLTEPLRRLFRLFPHSK